MTRAPAAVAAALALGACSYDFTNPAEQLFHGQVAGRVVADVSGTGSFSAMPGVSVALQNSPFDQVTRETGRFTLLGMPAGRHTVVFRKGTTWALQRDVEVGYGPDGQPEGVAVGDVRLRYTVTLQGTFSVPPAPPGTTFTADTWIVEDEGTGARAALASGGPGQVAYTLQGLPVGTHRIRFAVAGQVFDPFLALAFPQSYVGGPLVLTVPESSEGQALTLNPMALRATDAGTGKLQLKIAIVASSPVSASGSFVMLSPAPPPEANLTPDSSGYVEADLPEGVYTLDVLPPLDAGGGTGAPLFLQAPPSRTLTISKDRVTELGVLYAVEDSVATGTALACVDDADCAPGTCSGGSCQGWTPATLPPPSTSFCAPDPAGDCAQFICVPCADGFGTCASSSRGDPVCMPAGLFECTPDGVSVAFFSGC